MSRPAKPPAAKAAKSVEPQAEHRPIKSASPKRMQMSDIARLAGVSTATVSRALSGSPLIPESTRQRITELAQSLNYRVNASAASLRKRDVQTVGVVMIGNDNQAISDPFLFSILGTVADRIDSMGMSLLLTRLKAGQEHRLSEMVASGQVSGLIVIGQVNWHQHLNLLSARGIPFSVWGACLPDALYSVVGGDNERGGYLATRHLIEQGCKRIAYFGDTTHPEAGARYQGYRRALQEAGREDDPRLEQAFLFGDLQIRRIIDGWLDRKLPFDAIFAASDVTAVAIMGALQDRQINVPGQVKVVGYDDIALAQHVHPSLTSVRQPTGEAGNALVDLMMESVAGRAKREVVLPAELIVRDSSR